MSHEAKQLSENNASSSSETEEPIDDHSLEKIIRKRINNGKSQYLIKWKGFTHAYNTWETEKSLNRDNIIKAFEKKLKLIKKKKAKCDLECTKSESSVASTSAEKSKDCRKSTLRQAKNVNKTDVVIKKKILVTEENENIKYGDPEIITNAADCEGVVMFILKRRGIEKPDVITSKEATDLCPQLVIEFYQKIIRWKSCEHNNNNLSKRYISVVFI